jgi:twitching motility protein PilT
MARIDSYLKSIERFSASGIVLKSNTHVLLRFPSGDRHATQTTTHEVLQDLVRAIVPSSQRLGLDTGNRTEFTYALDGARYRLQVLPGPTEWTVSIEPDGTGAAAAEPEIEHSASGNRRPAAPAVTVQRAAAPQTVRPIPPPAFGNPAAAATAETMAAVPTPAPIERPASPPPAAVAAAPPEAGDGSVRWIDRVLTYLRAQGGSDLHISTGSPPYIRVDGEIVALANEEPLEAGWLMQQLMEIAPEDNRAEFQERNDTDFAYNLPGQSRFRVNIFRDRNGPGAVMRQIPFRIPRAADLGLSAHILDLCNLTKGLVVVTGPTGSGKSTTLAAMIDHLNRTRRAHVITIEDPIEFVHENVMCLINQREVKTHTRSFKDALRAALREDPDVVLVGEMRDLETIAIAVETAETGHLVFGTLHTTTAPSTVERIIDQFPPDRQEQIRQMLAKSLKGVVAQVLCKKKGGGRIAAQEILIGTSAVENLIREGKTFQLGSLMQTGKNVGMQMMNDTLLELVKAGTVDAHEAYMKSVSKIEFKSQLQRAGFEV